LGGFDCDAAIKASCTINGILSTSYSAWQLNGKAAYDWKYGWVTITSSAVLFGGNSHVNQSLEQSLENFGGGKLFSGDLYVANTSLRWADAGARLGLDVSTPVTNMLTVGVGGWVGAAGRQSTLSGTDSASAFPSSLATILNGVGSVVANDTTGVFLANFEARFAHKLTPAMALRGFAGLNYDSHVPGITAPAFGTATIATPVPAGIYYSRETSYYAGAGLIVTSGPTVANY
jgi:hypothetical protein